MALQLTCYKLRSATSSVGPPGPLDYIDGDRLSSLNILGPTAGRNFSATLVTYQGNPDLPDWSTFLSAGFGNNLGLALTSSPAAVLIVEVDHRGNNEFLAFTFGTGRFLLRERAYERDFGLRVALNLVVPKDTEERGTLRAIDARRPSSNTVRMRHQASKTTTLEIFDLDIERDLLGGVTGQPVNSHWGRRVRGSDPFISTRALEFSQLGDYCSEVLDVGRRDDYKVALPWIDNVHLVRDEARIDELEQVVLERLRASETDEITLTVPEVVDWDQLHRFRYSFDRRKKPKVDRIDLSVDHYIRELRFKDRLDDLEISDLKRDHIDGLDGDGSVQYKWSTWKCLAAEIRLGSGAFVLDGGDFFEVEPAYLTRIDAFVDKIEQYGGSFEPAHPESHEAAYLQDVAANGDQYLLLDQRTVKTSSTTTKIEICDLYTEDGWFIHVKRKFSSATLSHLFAQGYVSANLLLGSPEFREEVVREIDSASAETAQGDRFLIREEHLLDSQRQKVVYGIIGAWDTKTASQKLPFFSKVNLKRYVEELRKMRFDVQLAAIQTDPNREILKNPQKSSD